jgi:RNA polymerase sigma-70 factor (ECF subfamily)
MEPRLNNNAPCYSIALEQFIAARCPRTLIIEPANLQQNVRATPEIASLTARMARGEEDAYRQFFDGYYNRLLRYLLVVTGNEESAREALQLTLLRVARYAKRFNTEEAFWSWLTVLARSAVADEGRKTRRYLAFLGRFFEHKQIESSTSKDEADVRLTELLENNLAALAADERDLLRRKYLDGESVRQMAEQMALTEKAVESRLSRIRRRLKEMVLEQLEKEVNALKP